MTKPTRYRQIEVAGTPREMGRQIGEAARDEVRGFVENALRCVNKTVDISREKAERIAQRCIAYAEQYSGSMVEELRGAAEAAGVTLVDLMLLQVRNQLQPDRDAGCSALSIAAEEAVDGQAIVAQNWDNDPELDAYTIVLTRRPLDRPALMTVTQAGLISYLGFNAAGIGACVNTLPAPARPVGVPHYFTLRGIYEATSLDGAVDAVARAARAIPANIMLATPQGPADLEVTIDHVHVLRDDRCGSLMHTNHCLHPELAAINDDFPELIQSHSRLARLTGLVEQRGKWSLSDVQTVLADHQDFPRSICRHANDDIECGFWETVFSIVCQPAAGRMYVTRGTPCCQPFELYELP